VIDEALSVGDVFFAQKCMRFLRDFQKRGTVLFVSHDASAIVNLCDRAIWLDDGRIAIDGPAKAVCEAYHASTYGHAPTAVAAASSAAASPAIDDDAVDEDAHDDAGLDASFARVFRFDPERVGFGDGRASIVDVRFEQADGTPLTQVVGGEVVRLVVVAQAHQSLQSPIVGFFLKDRLGQQLFGNNTYREDTLDTSADAGAQVRAVFEFRMPYLPRGRYTVDAAIADGSHLDHVQAAWVYDAVALESAASTVSTGLVGIPFRSITLDAREARG